MKRAVGFLRGAAALSALELRGMVRSPLVHLGLAGLVAGVAFVATTVGVRAPLPSVGALLFVPPVFVMFGVAGRMARDTVQGFRVQLRASGLTSLAYLLSVVIVALGVAAVLTAVTFAVVWPVAVGAGSIGRALAVRAALHAPLVAAFTISCGLGVAAIAGERARTNLTVAGATLVTWFCAAPLVLPLVSALELSPLSRAAWLKALAFSPVLNRLAAEDLVAFPLGPTATWSMALGLLAGWAAVLAGLLYGRFQSGRGWAGARRGGRWVAWAIPVGALVIMAAAPLALTEANANDFSRSQWPPGIVVAWRLVPSATNVSFDGTPVSLGATLHVSFLLTGAGAGPLNNVTLRLVSAEMDVAPSTVHVGQLHLSRETGGTRVQRIDQELSLRIHAVASVADPFVPFSLEIAADHAHDQYTGQLRALQGNAAVAGDVLRRAGAIGIASVAAAGFVALWGTWFARRA